MASYFFETITNAQAQGLTRGTLVLVVASDSIGLRRAAALVAAETEEPHEPAIEGNDIDWSGTDCLIFGREVVVTPQSFDLRKIDAGNDLIASGPVHFAEREPQDRFGPPPRNLGPHGSQCRGGKHNKMANYRR